MIRQIFAQQEYPLGVIQGEGLGPFGKIAYTGTSALTRLTQGISAIIGFMTILAAIWFIFQVLIGGFYWISSGGDKKKLHEARQRITNAFIGLIIVAAGWALLALAGMFLGLDTVIKNPGTIIEQIKIGP
jgi:hypothetical protein